MTYAEEAELGNKPVSDWSVILQTIVRVWFARLYGKIIHERQRVDYRPYRRTNHTLNYCTCMHMHLVHYEIFDV